MSMSEDAVDVMVASNFSASSVLPALGSPEAQFQQQMMNVMWDYGYAVGCTPCTSLVLVLWTGRARQTAGQQWPRLAPMDCKS